MPDIPRDEEQDDRPPATVLRESTPADNSGLDSELPMFEETGQVRQLPNLPNPPTWRIIFQSLGEKSSTIGVDVREPTIIGRSHASDLEDMPGLDLSKHSAQRSGVSRQHASLVPTNEALYLVDLDSRNGTWMNGRFVEPGKRYALSPGDRVEFGLFKLQVRTVTRVDKR